MNIPHIYEQAGYTRQIVQNPKSEIYLFLPIGDCKEINTDEQLAIEWANQ